MHNNTFPLKHSSSSSWRLNLECYFLVHIKLPRGYNESDNVEASTNQAIECVRFKTSVYVCHVVFDGVVMFLYRQVLDESRALDIEENAHEEELDDPPHTEEHPAQRRLVPTDRHRGCNNRDNSYNTPLHEESGGDAIYSTTRII